MFYMTSVADLIFLGCAIRNRLQILEVDVENLGLTASHLH